MRLVSLRIYKKINNEEIRFVKFNETGLSLICDDENDSNSEKHSSSLGKTTFIVNSKIRITKLVQITITNNGNI